MLPDLQGIVGLGNFARLLENREFDQSSGVPLDHRGSSLSIIYNTCFHV